MLRELVHEGQAKAGARLPAPTCPGAWARCPKSCPDSKGQGDRSSPFSCKFWPFAGQQQEAQGPGAMLLPCYPQLGSGGVVSSSSSSSASSSASFSSTSKVAQMAQPAGININSIQISIETELEMEDPMQLEPSSSFPHTDIPSVIPEPFTKPLGLGRGQQGATGETPESGRAVPAG